MRATIAKIHLNNFEHNINVIKSLIKPETKICVPIKADGYGHGAVRLANEAIRLDLDYFAVATVDEGAQLRDNSIDKPIMLLGIPQEEEIEHLVMLNLEPLVFDKVYIDKLQTAAKKFCKTINVHLKIDTGMGRLGCKSFEAGEVASYISRCGNLHLAGVCTHFAVSDSIKKENIEYTHKQISLFNKAVENIAQLGIDVGIRHAANSGAVLMYPEAHFDMIRPGIIVYGYAPDKEQYQYLLREKKLREEFLPLMELESAVVAIVPHEKDDSISYGRTFVCAEKSKMAVLPIGYADGLLRNFSKGLRIKINGKIYNQVGRICMDQCMVDIGNGNDVRIGDRATIFSCDKDFQTTDDIAQRIGTISYEILCGISKRVPRVYC